MKKLTACIFLTITIFLTTQAAYSRCSSNYQYLTHKDFSQKEIKFTDCDKHSLLKETTVYFYSNGTRRTYTKNTLQNIDGSIIATDFSKINHHIYENKHYFSFYKNKKYQIIDEKGRPVTVKKYTKMNEIAPNKFIVKAYKNYGIIDILENTVVPIKYKEFEQIGQNLFLTQLNGYYGLVDSSNNVLLSNVYDKITPLYETLLLKKQDKYGLTDKNGQLILAPQYESIKKLGEYIIIKKNKKYGLLDLYGNSLTDIEYDKIKLDRNTPIALKNRKWSTINTEKQSST